MGIAGAGKSVQGKLLAKTLDYDWMSTGELLRSQANESLKKEMLLGKLLDDDQIINLVEKYLAKEHERPIILDGFPRSLAQAEWLIKELEKGTIQVEGVANIIASEEVVKDRLASRGRPDDTNKAINCRFEEYKNTTLPILEYLRNSHLKVYDINGEQTVENVQAQINSIFVK